MTKTQRVLVIGAGGQIGTELSEALRTRYGNENVIASDIRDIPHLSQNGPFVHLDVMDFEALSGIIQEQGITQIYNLAALLSAIGEKKPDFAWELNMQGHLNVLKSARDYHLDRVFWPSSIAVFGPSTPRDQTPQTTVMEPNTVYGISKLAGERWSEYYFQRYGVDVRSIRYPGLIGYKSAPGGGTTDYAVDIFHQAIQEGQYTSFLSAGTALPMMYMPDAIRATIELMEAPAENIRIRSSYNLGGISFTPAELAAEIQKSLPEFKIDYAPDSRQKIADSWPNSIDDSAATRDWGWTHEYDLARMCKDMLFHIKAGEVSVPNN